MKQTFRIGGRGGGLVAAASPDIEDEIATVAEKHAPEGGYGETAWNADTGTVFWVCGDWTSNDEVIAAETDFLAVAGVETFEHEAEAALPTGDGWAQVWPHAGPAAEAASAELKPVPLTETRRERLRFLRRDFATPRTVAAPSHGSEALSERLIATLGNVAEKLAGREAPDVHVHLPEVKMPETLTIPIQIPEVAITAAAPPPTHVEVHVPEQPAPNVNVTVEAPEIPAPIVAAAPPPVVEVHVPPATVDVHVPAQPAPVVNVQNEVTVPRPRPIRVEELDDGTRRYIPEEE